MGKIRSINYVIGGSKEVPQGIIINKTVGKGKVFNMPDGERKTLTISRIEAKDYLSAPIQHFELWLSNGEEESLWKTIKCSFVEVEYETLELL
jgi:hypothetical protein